VICFRATYLCFAISQYIVLPHEFTWVLFVIALLMGVRKISFWHMRINKILNLIMVWSKKLDYGIIVRAEMNIWLTSWQLVITTHCRDTSYYGAALA
jgi:hypothetical protein